MSIYAGLQKAQQQNKSLLCVGLDLDAKRMPSDYAGSLKQMFEFAHRIIDATADLVCAYKPNLGFYEHHGPEGLSLLRLIIDRIPDGIPVILDGKRNDIGNTAGHYARALFDTFRADWVTLNPYMGQDSLRPFIDRKDKGSFILCLTSNAGSEDFQQLDVGGKPLYMDVAEKVASWNSESNCGLVVGATHPEQLQQVRSVAGDMPILIPGVGAQGGSLEQAVLAGTEDFTKLAVINVSRSVLYASNGPDFAQRARQELEKLNAIVNKLRRDDAANLTTEQADEQSDEQSGEQTREQSGPPPEIAEPPRAEESTSAPQWGPDDRSPEQDSRQSGTPDGGERESDDGERQDNRPQQHNRHDHQSDRRNDHHRDRRHGDRPGDRHGDRRNDRHGDRRNHQRSNRRDDRRDERRDERPDSRPQNQPEQTYHSSQQHQSVGPESRPQDQQQSDRPEDRQPDQQTTEKPTQANESGNEQAG